MERTRARRVVVDGLQALRNAAHAERLAGVWGALAQELRSRGVTMMIMAETHELFVKRIDVPVPGMSAAVDNIVLLGQTEEGSTIRRLLGVLKTRDQAHSRTLTEYEVTERGIRLAHRVVPRGGGYRSARPSNARARGGGQGKGRRRGKR